MVFVLVDDEIILLASEARKECAIAIATLGYDLKNFNFRSSVAQHYISLHNLQNLIVKHSVPISWLQLE